MIARAQRNASIDSTAISCFLLLVYRPQQCCALGVASRWQEGVRNRSKRGARTGRVPVDVRHDMVQLGVPEQCLNGFQRLSLSEKAICESPAARLATVAAPQSSITVQLRHAALQPVGRPIIDRLTSVIEAPFETKLETCALVRQDQAIGGHEASICATFA